MPRAYSADLRERVLRACERGRLSRARIAAVFGVGTSTLFRWQQQARAEGRRLAKPPRGGSAPRLDAAALAVLRALGGGGERPDAGRVRRAPGRAHRRAGERRHRLPGARAGLGPPVRKKASARRSRTGPSSSPSGRHGAPSWPRSTPTAWSSSTRAGSTPG